jgi:hypothetical protein
MSANVTNQIAFLRTSRNFPEDLKQLTVEVNRSYVDIANKVNSRVIGIFTQNVASINGEEWFINTANQKQQGFRRVFPLTSTANPIPHGINISTSPVVKAYGSFTDGTNYYGLLYASSTAIAGQLSFYLSGANINFLSGAGAPTLTSGTIVIEWLSQP